jgi:proteasome accessory factor C
LPSGKAAVRLRRLLVVVPYVVQHPGVGLGELAEAFGAQQDDLVEDLNLLFVSGLPPYGPGDLIDVQIEDGRVWIDMADYFARPLRMSRSEALALYLQGKALLGTPGLPEAPALSSALAKLEERLGPETLGRLAGRVETAEDGHPAETLDLLRRSASESERLEIEYYSASSEETSTRLIEPEEVFSALGNWYVVAWDPVAEGERMFRADRIRTARGTGERFQRRGLAGAGRPLYSRSDEDIRVRLLLGPRARWVAEYYETESSTERKGGQLEVVIPTKRIPWLARLVLSLGEDAIVLGPPELEEAMREVARKALSVYERRTLKGA